MEQLENKARSLMKRQKKRQFKTGSLCVLLFAVILLMIMNATGLQRAQKNTTIQYVSDVSEQLADDIAEQIQSYLRSLEQLADTIWRITQDIDMEEFLSRKANILGFDQLLIIPAEGAGQMAAVSMREIEKISEEEAVQQAFEGETSLTYITGESLLYVTPIGEQEKPDYVLAGIRSKENIQKLIAPSSFQGKGLTCILDKNAEVVISPTDIHAFQTLDEITKKGGNEKEQQKILQMISDIEEGRCGAFETKSVNGKGMVLSYQTLGINDWMLITLVPAGMISREINLYIVHNFFLAAGIILILVVLLLSILRSDRESRAQLLDIAFLDPLTGGKNRAGFRVAYEQIAGELEPGHAFFVLLNIRGFRLINESFGTEQGDRALQYIYKVISAQMREKELVSRSYMDHFLLLMRESDAKQVTARMEEIRQKVNAYTVRSGNDYRLKLIWGAYQIENPSLGFNLIEDRARTASKFLDAAETGGFYSVALMDQMKQEQDLNALFDRSLENREFQVYFQPKIRLRDNRIGGAEALVRWVHPVRGMISPGIFVPLFEKSENICRLDLFVFEEVCKFLQKRMQEKKQLFPVSVNLSRLHFRTPDFYCDYIRIKEAYQIPDGILELEMTESVYLDPKGRKKVRETLKQMQGNGFLCSLDDFGVGFSSLGLLRELEVDTIKLDRQFFEDVTDERSQKVICALIDLAVELGIHTVSEGVETQQQLEFLRRTPCDMVQGYVFSKPLPMDEFEIYADAR